MAAISVSAVNRELVTLWFYLFILYLFCVIPCLCELQVGYNISPSRRLLPSVYQIDIRELINDNGRYLTLINKMIFFFTCINYSHTTNLMNAAILSENLAYRELSICLSFNCLNIRNNIVTQPGPQLKLPS